MKSKISIIHIIYEVIKKNILKTIFLVICIILAILLSVTPPLVLEKAINLLTQKQMISLTLACFYFVLLALGGIFDSLKESMITIMGQKITHQVRLEMVNKLNHLSSNEYYLNDSGEMTSIFVGDVDSLEKLFTSGVISMIIDCLKIISILVIIFTKSKGLGILMIVMTPLLYFFTRISQKRMLSAQIDYRESIGKANHHIPETIKNMISIHVLNKEKYMSDKYKTYILDGFKAMEKSNFYDAIYSPIILVISSLIISIMMILATSNGIFMEWFGLSVGSAVAIISYVGKVFDPLESLGMEIQNIQSAMAGVHRISNFLKKENEIKTYVDVNSFDFSLPAIQMIDCCFGYDNNYLLLNYYNLTIHQQEKVTLFGKTGAGKSTLFKLILGLYEPIKGEVKIFGVKASQIPEVEKRKIFGYVEQEFHPIQGTIFEQVSLNDPFVSEKMVNQAITICGLNEIIDQLPLKLNNEYKPEFFSKGQQQLLSIARAIVYSPKILLLDEITANLDSNTEQKIITALQKASQDRCVISISHRLYSILDSRKIEIVSKSC